MLLKRGVLGFIENQTDEKDYYGQDINQILEKNSRRIDYSLGQSKNYTYSKSSFVGEEAATSLDINSNNFWQVALRDIESPLQKLNARTKSLHDFDTMAKQ